MSALLTRAARVGVIADIATRFYTNVGPQDRTRKLFAGMTPRQIWIGHKQGEWVAAKAERDVALLAGDDAGYARYDAMCDRLSAEIDELEETA